MRFFFLTSFLGSRILLWNIFLQFIIKAVQVVNLKPTISHQTALALTEGVFQLVKRSRCFWQPMDVFLVLGVPCTGLQVEVNSFEFSNCTDDILSYRTASGLICRTRWSAPCQYAPRAKAAMAALQQFLRSTQWHWWNMVEPNNLKSKLAVLESFEWYTSAFFWFRSRKMSGFWSHVLEQQRAMKLGRPAGNILWKLSQQAAEEIKGLAGAWN